MRPRQLTAALLLASAFCGPALSEADLYCEEAAEHVRVCCGFRPVGLDCQDQPVGCDSPDVPAEDSRCVGTQPCVALESSGYCAYARARWGDPPASYVPPEPEICR